MTNTLLRSGDIKDFQMLGQDGKAAFLVATQIRETLRVKLGREYADCLAIPQRNDQGNIVDWYIPFTSDASDGQYDIVPWTSASEEEREAARKLLDQFEQKVIALGKQLASNPNLEGDKLLFSRLLYDPTQSQTDEKKNLVAIRFPSAEYVYIVNGKPVITFWGFVLPQTDQTGSPFACLKFVPKPVVKTVPPPVVPVVTPWWKRWWLWLLALLLLLLLLFLLRGCFFKPDAAIPLPDHKTDVAPNLINKDKVDEKQPEKQPDIVKQPDVINQPIVTNPNHVVNGVNGTVDPNSTLDPNGAIDPNTKVDTNGVNDKPGDGTDLNKPPVLPPDINKDGDKDKNGKDSQDPNDNKDKNGADNDKKDNPDKKAGDNNDTDKKDNNNKDNNNKDNNNGKVDPNATTTKDNKLALPPDVLGQGSTQFLDGSWSVGGGIQDKATGKPLRLQYDFNKGNGEVTVTRSDGVKCVGNVGSSIAQSNLNINSNTEAQCSDNSKYQLPKIQCAAGKNNEADCQGFYKNGDKFPITMKKE